MVGRAGGHKSGVEYLNRKVPTLPSILLEDRLLLLRGLVVFAWCFLLAFIAIESLLRMDPTATWPDVAGFSATYNALLAVFALNTLVLTALLVFRDWFERVPRSAESRVGWLLALVLVWLGLHSFFLFHIAGAFSGALAALPVVLVIAMLVVLPGRAGWWFAFYMAGGHALVALLAEAAVIHPDGPLAPAFRPEGPLHGPALVALLALGLGVALWARGWMASKSVSDHPAQRVDPDTGLFRAAFLHERLQREMRRARRQNSASTLLILDVGDGRGAASEAERARPYAEMLMRNIRLSSDTPAHYRPGCLAVLMPAADGAAAQALCQRLVAAMQEAGLRIPRIGGAVVESATVDAARLAAAAESALLEAPEGGALHLVRL